MSKSVLFNPYVKKSLTKKELLLYLEQITVLISNNFNVFIREIDIKTIGRSISKFLKSSDIDLIYQPTIMKLITSDFSSSNIIKIPSIKKNSIRKVTSPMKEFTMYVVVNNYDRETNLLSVFPISTNLDLATNKTAIIQDESTLLPFVEFAVFTEFEFFVTINQVLPNIEIVLSERTISILKNLEKYSLNTGPKLNSVNDYRFMKRLEIKQLIEIFQRESKKVLGGEVKKIEEEFNNFNSVFVDNNISYFKSKKSESNFKKIINQENLLNLKELVLS